MSKASMEKAAVGAVADALASPALQKGLREVRDSVVSLWIDVDPVTETYEAAAVFIPRGEVMRLARTTLDEVAREIVLKKMAKRTSPGEVVFIIEATDGEGRFVTTASGFHQAAGGVS